MKNNSFWTVFTDLITALSFFLFIVSFSVTFTLNFRPLYYADIELLKIAESTGMDKELVKQNYDVLIDYNSIGSKERLEFPSFGMSDTGRIHFEEVKEIFVFFQKMMLVFGVLSFVLGYWKMRRKNPRYLRYTGTITFVVPVVLIALIAANWEKAFVLFHKVAFRNDYWLFDPQEDAIITILPSEFFLHCAIMIMGMIFLGSIISYVSYFKQKKKGCLKTEKDVY